tara:strand:- start:10 stop:252 length:243 start_codon:yes stop_codon:yes gene_type:complete
MTTAEHRRHKGLNNKVENAHQPTKNKGSLAGGIAVASLLAMAFATAFAFVANSHSQQYKDCIEQSDVTSNQCNKLYPAQR